MIRGIDSQIMINKSVDYAKQMADQQNNVQQGQDFISEMEKARMKQKDEAVTQTDHAENGRIRREKEDGESRDRQHPDGEPEEEKYSVGEELPGEEREDGIGASIDINV